MPNRPKHIIGNWKMHGTTSWRPVLAAIDAAAARRPQVQVTLSLPATLLALGAETLAQAMTGAQDCHGQDEGAFTGCLSAAMLREAGAVSVIVGHSERRRHQLEQSVDVAAKAAAARRQQLRAIVCVGESAAERDAGRAVAFVCDQLRQSLPEAPSSADFTVAYEPVWAVGTGLTPSLAEIDAVHAALRSTWRELAGEEDAARVQILYGGSVTADNAGAILSLPHVDGALVGGASLTVERFSPIIDAAARAG